MNMNPSQGANCLRVPSVRRHARQSSTTYVNGLSAAARAAVLELCRKVAPNDCAPKKQMM